MASQLLSTSDLNEIGKTVELALESKMKLFFGLRRKRRDFTRSRGRHERYPGTHGYRVPARKKILGTDGYRVRAKKIFLGPGYRQEKIFWVPAKFSTISTPD